MKFAVNFSLPLVRLLNEGAITVDLIKCPDWEGLISEAQGYGETTIHFDLEVGLGNTFNVDFSRIKALMDCTFTPHINTHLITPRQFDPYNRVELRQMNRLWRDEIQLMIDHLGTAAVALEQLPYTAANASIQPATDPEIFSQVVQDTGCMFLLDLAHARITANTLAVDVKDYVSAFPHDRLVELHITGIKPHSGVLTDHFELGDEDWSYFKWALDEIQIGKWRTPEIVAFEYGGIGQTFAWRNRAEVLTTQVPRLSEMVKACILSKTTG